MAATSVAAVKAAWWAANSRASPARQASTSQIAANQNKQIAKATRPPGAASHSAGTTSAEDSSAESANGRPSTRRSSALEKAPRGYPVPFFLAQRSNSSAAATAAVPCASRATSHGCGARAV